jgi:hypothetical protein
MARETVIVGCKLPNGLLLQVGNQTMRVNGRSQYRMPSPTRKDRNTDVKYADGLTVLNKDFWDTWVKEHRDYAPVKSGAIYASPSRSDAVAKARDTEEMKVGFEPMDPLKAGLGVPIEPSTDVDQPSERMASETSKGKRG